MLLAIMGVMSGGSATGTTPTTSVPTVASTGAGSCGGIIEDATLRVSWTIANPDAVNYSAKLYENGILVSTQDTSASMLWDKTVAGAVEGGPVSVWFSDWTYRVDVVIKSTGVVVSSQISSPWVQQYGGCGSGGGGGDGT